MDRCVAESSGVAVIERGTTWWIADRGTQWAATALFVLALVAGIGTIAGAVIAATVGWGGFVPLGLGVVAGVGFVFVLRWKRRRDAAPLEELRTSCGLDFAQGALVDPSGRPIYPLTHVHLHRAFQLTSSSPALELRHPGGGFVIVHGNPFGGGIDDVEHALQRGLQPRPG